MKFILLIVAATITPFAAHAAQSRTTVDVGRSEVAGAEPRWTARMVHDGGLSADLLQHADPWSLLGGSNAYKECLPESTVGTCYLRCKCGYDENMRKCGQTVTCRERAQLEKDACDGHCEADY
jgi:hypothetical protein